MGKNQTHKSMQMAKHASRGGGGGGEDVDPRYAGAPGLGGSAAGCAALQSWQRRGGAAQLPWSGWWWPRRPALHPRSPSGRAGHDASFHTAEWHAARLAALQMERPRCGRRAGQAGPEGGASASVPQACCLPPALPPAVQSPSALQPAAVRFRCACSWDDWKKQQDEAAAREAAMEAANAQADREPRRRRCCSACCCCCRQGRCRVRLPRACPSLTLPSRPLPPLLPQASTRRRWRRSGRGGWATPRWARGAGLAAAGQAALEGGARVPAAAACWRPACLRLPHAAGQRGGA